MTDTLALLLSSGAGMALGTFFFGGLWWTVRKGPGSRHPALLFLGSFLLRMSVAVAGFHFVAGGHWVRLLACLFGFVLARMLVAWLSRPAAVPRTFAPKGASHAS